MYVAVDQGKTAGVASAVEYFHPDNAPQLWINEVGVTATHRRKGIGRSLVQALIQEAKQRGCICAWLGTENNNESGKACFSSIPEGEDPQRFLLYEWNFHKNASR